MFRGLKRVLMAAAPAVVAGCGAPMLNPAATSSDCVQDSGLLGEWKATQPLEIRAVISPGSDSSQAPEGSYHVAITVYDKLEFKSAVGTEMLVTDIGGSRFADVFLAKADRDRLVNSYGFLAIPVH